MKAPASWISVEIRFTELQIFLKGFFRNIILIMKLVVVLRVPVLFTLFSKETGRNIREFRKGIVGFVKVPKKLINYKV